jgi:hypothetical protein
MIRPEDLDKLFAGGLPDWIGKPEKDPPPPAVDNLVHLRARCGIELGHRFYVFLLDINPSISFPIGQVPGIYSSRLNAGLWFNEGDVNPGVIVKVFCGDTTLGSPYGMRYFKADPKAGKIIISHNSLSLHGKLKAIQHSEYKDLGLPYSPKNDGVKFSIMEAP